MLKTNVNIKFLFVFLFIDIFVISMDIVSNGISSNVGTIDIVLEKLRFWFGIHNEGNITAWYSAAKYMAASVLFFLVFASRKNISFLCISALLFLMSADEGSQLHENIGHILSSWTAHLSGGRGIILSKPSIADWPYFYGVLAIGVILATLVFIYRSKAFRNSLLVMLSVGFATVLTGAVGFEVLNYHAATSRIWTPYVEELLECFGASILLFCAINQWATCFQSNISLRFKENIVNWMLGTAFTAATFCVCFGAYLYYHPMGFLVGVPDYVSEWEGCSLIKPGESLTDHEKVSTCHDKKLIAQLPRVSLAKGRYAVSLTYESARKDSEIAGEFTINNHRKSHFAKPVSSGQLFGTNGIANTITQVIDIEDSPVFNVFAYSNSCEPVDILKISIKAIK